MTVKRIVANLYATDPDKVRHFYQQLFGLKIAMDLGWISTLAATGKATPQLSISVEGGSGTPVPYLSIEVDDISNIYRRAQEMQLEIVYELTHEPWGVNRFFVRDPLGKIINVMAHSTKSVSH